VGMARNRDSVGKIAWELGAVAELPRRPPDVYFGGAASQPAWKITVSACLYVGEGRALSASIVRKLGRSGIRFRSRQGAQ